MKYSLHDLCVAMVRCSNGSTPRLMNSGQQVRVRAKRLRMAIYACFFENKDTHYKQRLYLINMSW